jgi:hypothetical protein
MKEQIKNLLREGLLQNKGLETACNKMSVATYKEGIALIIKAIGTPEQNPSMWKRIERPIKNWKDVNDLISHEIKTKRMSGDSMVDESNTWWSAVQSTICPK